jgi:DNA-binding XRE family transcriptional regulator
MWRFDMVARCIYVVERPDTLDIKIGMAENIEKRIVNLRSVFGFTGGRIYRTAKVKNPMVLEQKIHKMLSKHSIGREWFKFSFDIGKCLVKNMSNSYVPIFKPKPKETVLQKAIRQKCMMTMEEVANKIGVHPVTISNWNTGKAIMHPVSFRKLLDMGIPKSVLLNPSKEA